VANLVRRGAAGQVVEVLLPARQVRVACSERLVERAAWEIETRGGFIDGIVGLGEHTRSTHDIGGRLGASTAVTSSRTARVSVAWANFVIA